LFGLEPTLLESGVYVPPRDSPVFVPIFAPST